MKTINIIHKEDRYYITVKDGNNLVQSIIKGTFFKVLFFIWMTIRAMRRDAPQDKSPLSACHCRAEWPLIHKELQRRRHEKQLKLFLFKAKQRLT